MIVVYCTMFQTGHQIREVVCVDTNDTEVPDSECNERIRPRSE